MTKRFAAALDGPSGAGKSTVAKAAAARLGILYVDTGAMYRAVGLAVLRRGIGEDDAAGIEQVLPDPAPRPGRAARFPERGGRLRRNPQ